MSGTPTPATVWACGTPSGDPDARWPEPVVKKIVTSFTTPDAQVILLTGLPTPTPADQGPAGHLHDDSDDELRAALTTVRGLGRTARALPINPEAGAHRLASRPFWADSLDSPEHADTSETITEWPAPGPSGRDTVPPDADLVLASLHPHHGGNHASDQIAGLAARLLRTGGILAVLTHCDWSQGRLIDPTGAVVAAAQNSDLLYLQHIVVVHAPIHDGRFVTDPAGPDDRTHPHRPGMPATHRRVHSDLVVFSQPHDHDPSASGTPGPDPGTALLPIGRIAIQEGQHRA